MGVVVYAEEGETYEEKQVFGNNGQCQLFEPMLISYKFKLLSIKVGCN